MPTLVNITISDFDEFIKNFACIPSEQANTYLETFQPRFAEFFIKNQQNFMDVIKIARLHKVKYRFMDMTKPLLPEIFTDLESLKEFFTTFEKSLKLKEQMISAVFYRLAQMTATSDDFLTAFGFIQHFIGRKNNVQKVTQKKLEFLDRISEKFKIEDLITSDSSEDRNHVLDKISDETVRQIVSCYFKALDESSSIRLPLSDSNTAIKEREAPAKPSIFQSVLCFFRCGEKTGEPAERYTSTCSSP